MPADRGDSDAFPATQWSLIARVGAQDPVQREQALADICRLYWPPIYAFLCARGYSQHDAEDFTQGFFAQFLEGNHFSDLKPERGRLRSYLLASVKRHLASELRRENRLKRGGGVQVISMDAAELDQVIAAVGNDPDADPDRLFDRIWAVRVLETASLALEQRYREKGREITFEKLRPLLQGDQGDFDAAGIAEDLGVSPAALRVAVHRFRLRYGTCIREAVIETLGETGDADEELRYLMSLFS